MVTYRSFLLVVLASCAAKPQHAISVALVIDGNRDAVGAVPKAAVAGLELHAIEPVGPTTPPPDPSTTAIGDARVRYANGDFDACRGALDHIDLVHLLASGNRIAASRTLVLQAACAWGALDKSAARTTAARLASYGLEMPDLAVPPDVEKLIGDALAASGKAKRTSLTVTGESGARLTIDGREAGCAVPCTLDVAPGDHTVAADADGFEPAAVTVRSPDAKAVAIAQKPADADLAARQWRARIGRGQPAIDVVGAGLLGKLAKESRVAFVHADQRLTGGLVVAGKLVASTTRDRGDGAGLVRELAYDGGLLERPTLFQRPSFWIATTGLVILVAGAIIYATYQPDIKTSVGF